MANLNPNKTDIEAVFNRLRTIPTNKTCFDCNSKNPTWASVTYGVFICIDCSAVHRGLGVHLTFVRSTQLDTNWTWLQLRQMQLGGNANAMKFFSQHNCITSDAPKKYNSRAAQLYRDKLHQVAQNSLKTNSDKFEVKQYKNVSEQRNKLHIHPSVENPTEEKEVDFFEEHVQSFSSSEEVVQPFVQNNVRTPASQKLDESALQPSVNLENASLHNEERKSTIGVRKAQPKKSGLGAKKSGLGATKVKTNFAELEREAVALDEARIQAAADAEKAAVMTAAEEEKRMASMRLAYQDLSIQQKKQEDKLKQTDPKKAKQVERLGMGFANRSGVSHSVQSDMKTIEQENLQTNTSSLSKLGRMNNKDSFFDDFSTFSSSSFSMNRNSTGYGKDNDESEDDFFIVPKVSNERYMWSSMEPKEKPRPSARTPVDRTISKEPESDMAQKKFGGAKAISSDQFFDNRSDDYETKANLNRFQGSSSISSSDYFGTGREQNNQANFHAPDLDDVRESVRQGVTKVAGKLSSLASGVMSSIQDRYGY